MSSHDFDADYYLRGKATGKSLYEDYRWLPDLTIPMVVRLISYLGIQADHRILDFGCARGYTVRAFREMGYDATGHDTSEWAVANADGAVAHYLTATPSIAFAADYDWVIAKDVLEHVEPIQETVDLLMGHATVGVFVVVPLALRDSDGYNVPEYEQDVTHIHRFTLATWASLFVRPGWSVTMAYRVLGVKDNYAKWEQGNGFLTARRIEG